MDFDVIADQSRASIEKEDLKVLLPLVAKTKPKVVLEIGMHRGYSMEVWDKLVTEYPRAIIGLEKDPPTSDSYIMYDSLFNKDSHDPSVPGLIQHIIIKSQIEYETGRYTDKIDFLFIDGDHSLEGVTQDFEMYSPLVRKGGIIAFHDVLHYNKDPEVNVKPLWEELKTKYPYVEIKVGKNSTGIGVIFV